MDRQAAAERVVANGRDKIKKLIKDGKYYEAHQLCRTLHFRCINARKLDDAADLLYDCALQLLRCRQFESGMDLSILLIDVLRKQSTAFERSRADTICERFAALFSAMDIKNCDSPLRMRFKKSAIEYLDTMTIANETDRSLRLALVSRFHHRMAVACWNQSSFTESRYHFERTNDGESYGKMLVQYQLSRGYTDEAAAFAVQAVLSLIVLGKPSSAARCFKAYCMAHPRISLPPPIRGCPLLNFAYFLLLGISYVQKLPNAGIETAKQSQSLFAFLCERYAIVLEKESSFREQLDVIGQLYFSVPAPARPQGSANQFGSLFSNVFQLLRDNTNADSSNTVPRPPNPANPSGALTFGSMFRGMLSDMIGEDNMSDDDDDVLLD